MSGNELIVDLPFSSFRKIAWLGKDASGTTTLEEIDNPAYATEEDQEATRLFDESRPVDANGIPLTPSALSWRLMAELVEMQKKHRGG